MVNQSYNPASEDIQNRHVLYRLAGCASDKHGLAYDPLDADAFACFREQVEIYAQECDRAGVLIGHIISAISGSVITGALVYWLVA